MSAPTVEGWYWAHKAYTRWEVVEVRRTDGGDLVLWRTNRRFEEVLDGWVWGPRIPTPDEGGSEIEQLRAEVAELQRLASPLSVE